MLFKLKKKKITFPFLGIILIFKISFYHLDFLTKKSLCLSLMKLSTYTYRSGHISMGLVANKSVGKYHKV